LRVGLKIKKKKKYTLIDKINILNIVSRAKKYACKLVYRYKEDSDESKVLRSKDSARRLKTRLKTRLKLRLSQPV
jgi:hypothetical protein